VGFLLDTNVVSEARRPRGDAGVKRWMASAPSGELYLSVLTVGEIRRGVQRLRRRDPGQAEAYEEWLETLGRDYAERLLPVTAEVAEEWGRITAGDPVPAIDGLIAATAKVAGMTLVTRNTSDVESTGVRLLNPFSEAGRS
jgi:predicted nucleic acid-binding protein